MVGRRIVAVHQETLCTQGGTQYANLEHIELDDGRLLYVVVHELEGDYGVELMVTKRPGRGRKDR